MIVLNGFQQQLELRSRAFEANALVSEATLQMAAGSFSVLSVLQQKLETSSFACSNALAIISSMTIHSNSSTPAADLIVSIQANGRYALKGPGTDNLTALRPFGGFVLGFLNFEVVSSVSATGGDLTYYRTEHHFFHLPLLLDRSISLCRSASRYLVSRIDAILHDGFECNARTLDAVAQDADLTYSGASAEGLATSFSVTTTPQSKCGAIDYMIVVQQPNVVGVDDTFTWRLSEGGSLSP